MDHMARWSILMVFKVKTIFKMSLQLFISLKVTVLSDCISLGSKEKQTYEGTILSDFTFREIYHLAIRVENVKRKS